VVIRFLLDTNVVAEGARPRPNALVISRLERHGQESAISAITWHELCFGVERLPAGRRRDGLEVFVRSIAQTFPVLPYDQRAADWHGRQRAALEGFGRPVPFADMQNAAVAATNGLTLITRNLKDVDGVAGLAAVSWWEE